ncbi:hypothetical protein WJ70_28705 [Burkholderia ubonensis]|nr:hypothetical protein WJ70_28705 [Burkholderia ubonensis]
MQRAYLLTLFNQIFNRGDISAAAAGSCYSFDARIPFRLELNQFLRTNRCVSLKVTQALFLSGKRFKQTIDVFFVDSRNSGTFVAFKALQTFHQTAKQDNT